MYTYKCRVCGKDFGCTSLKRKTCSQACRDKEIGRRPQVEVTCQVCGKTWKTTRAERRTCGRDCEAIWRSRNRVKSELDGTYTCSRCKTSKPVSEYYTNSKGAPRSYCKACDNGLTLVRQRNRKKEFVELKGGKCERCGYNRCLGALEFHHMDPSKKEFQISKNRSLESMQEELDKCILLCANCHKEEHTSKEAW